MTPVEILKIVLATSPTPEQVLAALGAGGFKVVSVAPPEPLAGDIIDDPAGFVREILARRKISHLKLANECGLAHTTIRRGLGMDPKYKNVFTARTLKIIRDWDRNHVDA